MTIIGSQLPHRSQADEPVDRMTMKLRRSSSMRFKYRPSGRRMTRLSSFLSEAGTAAGGADAANRLSLAAPNRRSSSGGTANGALGGVSTSLQSGDRNSRGSGTGAGNRFSRRTSRMSRLQGSIRESFSQKGNELGGKVDFSIQALIREEFKEIDEEEWED
jgi:hypothetical protein